MFGPSLVHLAHSGDNLDGLKHLLKSYARKVKCIYIDPPYNTGSDGFVYNDSYNFTAEDLSEKLSISEEQAKRILDLTKRGSASHSAWLMFMYPRLLLARDLLTDDGTIFISIDDNEQANLKLICDDVFGEENFVANIIVQANKRGQTYPRRITVKQIFVRRFWSCSTTDNRKHSNYFVFIPFRRNVSYPFNAAVLHRPVATDALGDCLRNDRLFQLFVFFNGRTGLFQYSVNLGALRIQKRRNALLLGKWWDNDWLIL